MSCLRHFLLLSSGFFNVTHVSTPLWHATHDTSPFTVDVFNLDVLFFVIFGNCTAFEIAQHKVTTGFPIEVGASFAHNILLIRHKKVHQLFSRMCVSKSKNSSLVAVKDF